MSESHIDRQEYRKMASLSLEELARDCEFEAFRGHGPGGQGINTTDSAVRARHLPTGIVVTCRESRSQFQNRQKCLRKIRDELERRGAPRQHRVPTRPTRSSQVRRVDDKKAHGQIKRLRREIRGWDE